MALMWVDDRSTEKPPLRPALLAGVAAWRSRCPFCQQSMIAAPVDASFCKRCGHSLQRHAQRFPTGDFEAWLPRAVGPYQVIPSLSVRHADILSTAQDTRSGAGVILQLMQIDGDPFGPWHAHFEKAIGGFRTLGHGR